MHTLAGQKISLDEFREELNNTSPLQMSKKLISYEINDQNDSLEVLNQIHEQLESKESLVDSLMQPLLLSLADGLVKHPKLHGGFRKTKITPSRIVNEVMAFSYTESSESSWNDDVASMQGEKTYYDSNGFHRNKFYDTKPRSNTEQDKGIVRDQTVTYVNRKGKLKTVKTTTVKDEITGEDLDLTRAGAQQKGVQQANMDHVLPINYLRKLFKNNPYLYRDDIEKIVGLPSNEAYISSSVNQAKLDFTFKEAIENGRLAHLSDEEKRRALELQRQAEEDTNKEAAKLMAKNVGLEVLGDLIIHSLKPIWFEVNQMVTKGVLYGFEQNTADKIEAVIFRVRRAVAYIKDNILSTLKGSLKNIFTNLISVLISKLLDFVKGFFKKILSMISDGFFAIKEAIKILLKDKDANGNKLSSLQKADAITKLIATSITPILIFQFEEVLSKIPVFGEVATLILSGIASTLVVWILNEIDIFSVKGEIRAARIKEIFQLRVQNIKENTDMFASESIQNLAHQKAQFLSVIDSLDESVEEGMALNEHVHNVANFFQVDIQIKTTDSFLTMLSENKTIVI
ncbi:hypothetical protein [Thiomicrorhabdus cannonii]|uniref:hypothetical protein n=1 Tax=Thiomicrorhabdus cannonii TaxID=2748011 RepID=UPI0015BB471C|nr:hypothetical protein [Thiomicrorhabdus cannonii]